MAFSTQRGFLHFPFLNQYPQPYCPPMDGVRLKTYAEIRDGRAWSLNPGKRSQYLIDLVTCRMYNDEGSGEPTVNRLYPTIQGSVADFLPRNQEVNGENNDIIVRLNESQGKLKTLTKENEGLNAVFKDELPQSDLLEKIKKKIFQLQKDSKINKNDEKELIAMLDALNNANRRDLLNRSDAPSTSKLGKSNDLQDEVITLRKEVSRLKAAEGGKSSNGKGGENVDAIIAERNLLREKVENFASLEGKITEWKHDSEQFKNFKKKACMTLKQKDEKIQDCEERIDEVEYQFKEMVKCFKVKEQEQEAMRASYECLKKENQMLKEELCRNKCELKSLGPLHNQIQVLSNELCEKNCAIEQYDLQFQQLLNVIEGLQNRVNEATDNLPARKAENIEELAATTRVTLDQISKELESRHELETDLAHSIAQLDTIRRISMEKEREALHELNAVEAENRDLADRLQKICAAIRESLELMNIEVIPGESCLSQIGRLRESVKKTKSNYKNELDKLTRRSIQQDEDLRKQNEELNKALDKIDTLDQKNKEVGKLVKDISSVQGRNDNLETVLQAVDYSDKYKKEIDDLRNALAEEQANNKKLSQGLDGKDKSVCDDLKKQLEAEKTKNKEHENCEKIIADLKKQLDVEKKRASETDDLKKLLAEEKKVNKRLSETKARMDGEKSKASDQQKNKLDAEHDVDDSGKSKQKKDGEKGSASDQQKKKLDAEHDVDDSGKSKPKMDGKRGSAASDQQKKKLDAEHDVDDSGKSKPKMGGEKGKASDQQKNKLDAEHDVDDSGKSKPKMDGEKGKSSDQQKNKLDAEHADDDSGKPKQKMGGEKGKASDQQKQKLDAGHADDDSGKSKPKTGGEKGKTSDKQKNKLDPEYANLDSPDQDKTMQQKDSPKSDAEKPGTGLKGKEKLKKGTDGEDLKGKELDEEIEISGQREQGRVKKEEFDEEMESKVKKEFQGKAKKEFDEEGANIDSLGQVKIKQEFDPDDPNVDSPVKEKLKADGEKARAGPLKQGKKPLGEQDSRSKALAVSPHDKKSKLMQLQKLHEATRNAERNFYEKEIEGHRMSNELLKDSLTKLTQKVNSCSVAEFEREMRCVLDQFVSDICKWRCEKNIKKLTKLQEICKKIIEYGIHCLTYKELVYLHQRMSEAALRLKPNSLSSTTGTTTSTTIETNSSSNIVCCKCSGRLCEIPLNPTQCNMIFMEKMSVLEREIRVAREELRRSKEEREKRNLYDFDQSDSDTLRNVPNYNVCLPARKHVYKPKPIHYSYKLKEEEFQIPTKDRCG